MQVDFMMELQLVFDIDFGYGCTLASCLSEICFLETFPSESFQF